MPACLSDIQADKLLRMARLALPHLSLLALTRRLRCPQEQATVAVLDVTVGRHFLSFSAPLGPC